MTYSVRFRTKKKGLEYNSVEFHEMFPVAMPAASMGTKEVESLREDLGKGISLEDISEFIPSRFVDVTVDFGEDEAQRMEVFNHCSSVQVYVNKAAFNVAVRLRNEVLKVGKNIQYISRYEVDESIILKAWMDVGYPTDWQKAKRDIKVEFKKRWF